jgi:hypothetical protein
MRTSTLNYLTRAAVESLHTVNHAFASNNEMRIPQSPRLACHQMWVQGPRRLPRLCRNPTGERKRRTAGGSRAARDGREARGRIGGARTRDAVQRRGKRKNPLNKGDFTASRLTKRHQNVTFDHSGSSTFLQRGSPPPPPWRLLPGFFHGPEFPKLNLTFWRPFYIVASPLAGV